MGAQRSKLRPFWSPWRVEKIFGDQNSGESRVMVTILQLKVAKRRLFEKVSLEPWSKGVSQQCVASYIVYYLSDHERKTGCQ